MTNKMRILGAIFVLLMFLFFRTFFFNDPHSIEKRDYLTNSWVDNNHSTIIEFYSDDTGDMVSEDFYNGGFTYNLNNNFVSIFDKKGILYKGRCTSDRDTLFLEVDGKEYFFLKERNN